MKSPDRFNDGIRAAARVLAAHGIDARPYLDRLDDATRAEIGGILVTRPKGWTEWTDRHGPGLDARRGRRSDDRGGIRPAPGPPPHRARGAARSKPVEETHPAPSPPETPAPVHYLARFAAGAFIACDPTIKDGWTPDPLAVTCEECRKVVRWRCEQVPPPETPATNGARKPSPWMDPNHAFGPPYRTTPDDDRSRCERCRRRVIPSDFDPGEPVVCLECSEAAASPASAREGNVDRSCTATLGPDEDDPHVYVCDRKATHTTLHSTGPEGEEIAWWCSCPDCASPPPEPPETPAYVEAPKRPRPPGGGRTEWRCGCGAWNRAPCRVCGKGPDERYASGAELDRLAGSGS